MQATILDDEIVTQSTALLLFRSRILVIVCIKVIKTL
jgi:hypothetical protein